MTGFNQSSCFSTTGWPAKQGSFNNSKPLVNTEKNTEARHENHIQVGLIAGTASAWTANHTKDLNKEKKRGE
jgi:hypothetical protein